MEQIKRAFNDAIAQETDPDKVARLEICREYMTNPAFRAKLEEFTFQQDQGTPNG